MPWPKIRGGVGGVGGVGGDGGGRVEGISKLPNQPLQPRSMALCARSMYTLHYEEVDLTSHCRVSLGSSVKIISSEELRMARISSRDRASWSSDPLAHTTWLADELEVIHR